MGPRLALSEHEHSNRKQLQTEVRAKGAGWKDKRLVNSQQKAHAIQQRYTEALITDAHRIIQYKEELKKKKRRRSDDRLFFAIFNFAYNLVRLVQTLEGFR